MSLALLQSYESDSSGSEENAHDTNPVETPVNYEEKPSKPASAVADEANRETSNEKRHATDQEDKSNYKHQSRKGHAFVDIPPDLVRELKAAGHDTADINIVDIGPAPISNQPHPSAHIPQYALRNNAMRLARHITKESVSSTARRKHQITALAAEAVALQVAQDTMPGAARPGSRKNGKFK